MTQSYKRPYELLLHGLSLFQTLCLMPPVVAAAQLKSSSKIAPLKLFIVSISTEMARLTNTRLPKCSNLWRKMWIWRWFKLQSRGSRLAANET